MDTRLHFDVAIFKIQLTFKDAGVRAVADGDEQAGHFQRLDVIGVLGITNAQTRHAHLIACHLFKGTVSVQHDVAAGHFVHQAFDEDLLRAEGFATVDKMHLRGDVGQVQCLFHRGVAAADHRDLLVAIEETIAGSAGRDAAALKGLFRRQPQVTGRGAGGDNQRVAGIYAVITGEGEGAVLQIHFMNVIEQNFGFEFGRMLVHTFHQQRPGQVIRIAWPVLHFGCGGQLTAFFHARN